ncbi:hypothetical protein RI129_008464 [Pyrocoelia pectoralis]|uniref:Tetraspanin n=1 Tax=Pyrocoelia pectoralis TaxID=417401 RepID=A0AAN7V7D9_9COLE
MVLANIEWIGTLCALLTLICFLQLIITGVLLWNIPEVLSLTKGHIATLAGLIACFVTLPAVIRFKTARMTPSMDRTYGYTICYQQLTITVAATLHLSATILTVVSLIVGVHLGNDFLNLMPSYNTKLSAKILIDNIQFTLQCCGAYSYKDWFEIKEKSSVEFDEVPFSCCRKLANSSCNFKNLEGSDTSTINTDGCGLKLEHFVHTLLWYEFAVYGICFCLEAAIMVLLTGSVEEEMDRIPNTESVEWATFLNQNSSDAIIPPSSHTEKKINIAI